MNPPGPSAGTRPKVIVVMPAYNAAKTLQRTHAEIPPDVVDEVILVDDGSSDETAEVARKLRLHVIRHPHNVGYGGNQRTCYMEALRRGADVVVMLHPDGQYDPSVLGDLVAPIADGQADFVIGSRMKIKGGARQGGMPRYKFLANKFLTFVENLVLGTRLSEFHSGYRAFSRRLLETVPFLRNSNGFVFDQQIVAQAVAFGFRIHEVPIRTRYFPEASSASFGQSMVYGLGTIWTMWRYLLHRLRLWRSPLFSP
ncbi:MAG: glycosyltransferase family 2 protein [Actinomycetota bacterium]